MPANGFQMRWLCVPEQPHQHIFGHVAVEDDGLTSGIGGDVTVANAALRTHGNLLNVLRQDVTTIRQDVTVLRRDVEVVNTRLDAVDTRLATIETNIAAILAAVASRDPADSRA